MRAHFLNCSTLTWVFFLSALAAVKAADVSSATNSVLPSAAATPSSINVQFSGGFDTDPRDRGRPVILVAAALGVPADVFREAFTRVRPAPAGEQPQPDQVRKNKQALMEALEPLGVTNDRLDEVSNYYRYRRSEGELWRHKPATATATVLNGTVTGIVLTDPGAGYSSTPVALILGMPQVKLRVKLSFGLDLATNGSVQEVSLIPNGTDDVR